MTDDGIEAAPLTDLTAFQRDLLVATKRIDDPQPTGLAIKAWLETAHGEEIVHSKIYHNYGTLEEKGLVSIDEVDGRTNAYRLSPRGERELDAHCRWMCPRKERAGTRDTHSEP